MRNILTPNKYAMFLHSACLKISDIQILVGNIFFLGEDCKCHWKYITRLIQMKLFIKKYRLKFASESVPEPIFDGR